MEFASHEAFAGSMNRALGRVRNGDFGYSTARSARLLGLTRPKNVKKVFETLIFFRGEVSAIVSNFKQRKKY